MSRFLCKILLIFCRVFSTFQQSSLDDNLWTAYQRCKTEFGTTTWLCDSDKRLSNETTQDLSNLLWRFQTDVPCYCKFIDDCYRYNVSIQSGVVAAMVIVSDIPLTVDETVKRIYDDAELATKRCSNGVLIVYATQANELYTYRGKLTEINLSPQQAIDAMNNTVQTIDENGDEIRNALPQLLRTYINYLKGPTYGRQNNWEAMVGMTVAVVICAFVAAAALAIFCSSLCKKKKKDKIEKVSLPPPPTPVFVDEKLKNKSSHSAGYQAYVTYPPSMVSIPGAPSRTGTPSRLGGGGGGGTLNKKEPKVGLAKLTEAYPTMPSPSEEPAYYISEPSTIYGTLPRTQASNNQQQQQQPTSIDRQYCSPFSTVERYYGSPEALSAGTLRSKGRRNRHRRMSLPAFLPPIQPPISLAYPLYVDHSPRQLSESQARLVPAAYSPLRTERETQQKRIMLGFSGRDKSQHMKKENKQHISKSLRMNIDDGNRDGSMLI